MTEQLSVCFVWHMHQPLYKDRLADKYLMPWVRLHALKDYLDMPLILEDYPKIRQTFNLVPSLIEQINDYAHNNASDRELDLLNKDFNSYSNVDKLYILNNSFHAELETQIKIYPYYYQLYKKKMNLLKNNFKVEEIIGDFNPQEYFDMLMWFNLCWFDNLWLESYSELKSLVDKGKDFNQEDRQNLIKCQQKILKEVIPTYKRLQEKGQIEVITTPYYHPILPLLIDTNSAVLANTYTSLPQKCYLFPKDAQAQIKKACDLYEKSFGCKPKGMWPSEMSVSVQALNLIAKEGFEWVVLNEGLLTKSTDKQIIRDENGNLVNAETICQPYKLKMSDCDINLFFREIVISDEIGFSYGHRPPQDAASALYMRLKHIQQKLFNWSHEGCVVIALDGENCWQTYEKDGQTFLRELYRRLSQDSTLNICTVSEYLSRSKSNECLYNLKPGSWINSDFHIWIGDKQKNRAWDLLWDTRTFLENQIKSGEYSQEILDKALEEIYAAEGSDWFWWYGEPNNSEHDALFDELFRQNLKNVYVILKKEYPKELDLPVGDQIR